MTINLTHHDISAIAVKMDGQPGFLCNDTIERYEDILKNLWRIGTEGGKVQIRCAEPGDMPFTCYLSSTTDTALARNLAQVEQGRRDFDFSPGTLGVIAAHSNREQYHSSDKERQDRQDFAVALWRLGKEGGTLTVRCSKPCKSKILPKDRWSHQHMKNAAEGFGPWVFGAPLNRWNLA